MALKNLKKCIVGDYEVQDIILGRGNFATVYLAVHNIIGCKVAFKVINLEDIKDEYVSRNLHREAQILSRLRHPNIIQLYESLTTSELHCLALERVRGVNLYQYLKHCYLEEEHAQLFFYQMLSAVQHMHKLSILHRDLKQENILIEYDRIVKIVDFGLSNAYFPTNRMRTHCGSMEYAAPELFYRTSYGPGVDLWSLGVVLYVMVIGKLPFVYNRKEQKGHGSTEERDEFIQKIAKGLTCEHWKSMESLSLECCNMLENLLQPDTFKRIRMKDAMEHAWFKTHFPLKRYLPQVRPDLRRKFRPEVLAYLAEKHGSTAEQMGKHVATYQHDCISSMYHMTLDTLIKEVVYPPKDFEQSFLFQFDSWKSTYVSKARRNRKEFWEQYDANQGSAMRAVDKSFIPSRAWRNISSCNERIVPNYFNTNIKKIIHRPEYIQNKLKNEVPRKIIKNQNNSHEVFKPISTTIYANKSQRSQERKTHISASNSEDRLSDIAPSSEGTRLIRYTGTKNVSGCSSNKVKSSEPSSEGRDETALMPNDQKSCVTKDLRVATECDEQKSLLVQTQPLYRSYRSTRPGSIPPLHEAKQEVRKTEKLKQEQRSNTKSTNSEESKSINSTGSKNYCSEECTSASKTVANKPHDFNLKSTYQPYSPFTNALCRNSQNTRNSDRLRECTKPFLRNSYPGERSAKIIDRCEQGDHSSPERSATEIRAPIKETSKNSIPTGKHEAHKAIDAYGDRYSHVKSNWDSKKPQRTQSRTIWFNNSTWKQEEKKNAEKCASDVNPPENFNLDRKNNVKVYQSSQRRQNHSKYTSTHIPTYTSARPSNLLEKYRFGRPAASMRKSGEEISKKASFCSSI